MVEQEFRAGCYYHPVLGPVVNPPRRLCIETRNKPMRWWRIWARAVASGGGYDEFVRLCVDELEFIAQERELRAAYGRVVAHACEARDYKVLSLPS